MPLEELQRAGAKIVGAKQTLKACQKGQVTKVFMALDAQNHVTQPILEACRDRGIEVEMVPSMEELGQACGIEVGSALAAILAPPG